MAAVSQVGQYLREQVYPQLDAVATNLLDDLNPKRRGQARYYTMDCPSCDGKQTAFYYPGSAVINCNRRSSCERLVTPIWEVLARTTSSKKETLERLCVAAGVPLPEDGRSKTEKTAATLAFDLLDVLRAALWENPDALAYLRSERGMKDDEIRSAHVGYYPNPDHVSKSLAARGAHLPTAQAWGLVDPRSAKKFSGRIVGYWEQPDGSIRLWGRAFGRSMASYMDKGELVEPNKYEYQYGLVKTVPYRFSSVSRRGSLIAVEGPLDVERMAVNGIPAIGVGGAMVIEAQTVFLASKGVASIIHLTDGDRAGHEGALKTIENAEPLGISVMVSEIPEGMDDPDKVIATSGPEPINALLENAISAGTFLAADMLALTKKASNDYPIRVRQIFRTADHLTTASRMSFDLAVKKAGIQLPDSRASALRTMATLIDLGVADEEVDRILRDRHGVKVTVNEVKANE